MLWFYLNFNSKKTHEKRSYWALESASQKRTTNEKRHRNCNARMRTKYCPKMHHNLLKSIFYMTHFSRTFWRFGNDFISEKTIILVFSQWNKSSGYFLDKARKKVCHALLTYKLRVWRKLMYVFCTVKTTNLFQKWRNFLLRKTRNSFYQKTRNYLLPKTRNFPSTSTNRFHEQL